MPERLAEVAERELGVDLDPVDREALVLALAREIEAPNEPVPNDTPLFPEAAHAA